MTDKPEKSPGEASREGLEMLNEHAHPHHMTTRDDATKTKHVSKPAVPVPDVAHHDGPLTDQKR
jgi:hypothetical protein